MQMPSVESGPVRDLVVWVIVLVIVNLVGREPETVRLHTAIVEFQRCNSKATKSLRGMGTEPTSMGFGTEASPVGSPVSHPAFRCLGAAT